MTCTEVEALLHEELDGELPVGEAQTLREHVATCPRCAALRDGLQQVLATTRQLAVNPTATPDLVASVTRSLRRRRQLRLALMGSLATAAGLLLFIVATWQSVPLVTLPPPPGARLPAGMMTPEAASSQADFMKLFLDEGLTWVQEAWQRTQQEVASLAQSATAAEEGVVWEGEGSWWEEVSATGDALQRITREVSKRILPVEVPYLNEPPQEQEKV